MAPSRGYGVLLKWYSLPRDTGLSARLPASRRAQHAALPGRHGLHSFGLPWTVHNFAKGHIVRASTVSTRREFSSFTEQLANPVNRLQCYVSSSDDPYLNLSVEDHILRKSPAKSIVLFLYANRPCVVIGRNQNPWTEVNLGILKAQSSPPAHSSDPWAIGTVDLVRRRSGGGTVFHDQGNLNWSVTCPREDFTRDKHAEMTVRALRKLGVARARVNERHDIVLDQGHKERVTDNSDTHRTPFTLDDGALPCPLKVSGSAYKLTRERALHHATTLLRSPNLHVIPQYLQSPAKKLIQAKGVESVSSPVGNIGLDIPTFQRQLQKEFVAMYADIGQPNIIATVGDEHLQVPEIRKGYDELQTEDWMWSQTPQFHLLLDSGDDVGIGIDVHHGIIKSLEFKNDLIPRKTQQELKSILTKQKLQCIGEWESFLRPRLRRWDEHTAKMAMRLDEVLPVPKLRNA